MFVEILMMAGVIVAATGIGLEWYKHYQNRLDQKKKEEKQKADESIGVNVAAGHFST
jgi:hypothetical protein